MLCRGTGFQDGKFRVYLHYREQHTPKETIDFLKREYGTGGGTHIFTDGTQGNTWHDGEGITITKDSIAEPDTKIILPWAKVQKRIGELIAADRYLNSKEKERLPAYQQQMEERRRHLAEEAYAREILNREPAPAEPKLPASKDTVKYAFHLGDTVYLGTEEYEILSFDGGTVQLRDTRYPLFIKELPREAFERMLRDNPLNDHLIAPEQPAEEKTEIPSPRALYRTYLSEIVGRVRTDEIYPYLRDRDTDPDSAKRELDVAIDRIVLSMREEHPDFYEAYTSLPQFREWLHEDVFQRIYQDHLADSRDSITIHADDPGAPEWARETSGITIPRKDNTVTIESSGEGEKHDVELDLELPESQTEQEEKEPAEKEIAAGMELSIEDRRYAIDAIDEEAGTVSLRDITFQSSTGFPIFRSESIEFVRGVLEQAKELIWQKTRGGEVSKVIIDLKPETPKPHQPRINYRITDNNLGHGGQKTKYGWNVAAIRLLNRLEKENRLATPEEQEILSRYVGWGGLPQAFDENNTQWAKEYAELKELLTDEEYASARASTLNAHYTSPTVIKAMYACLENMGFKTGNILEPACGIGNFFGLIPDSMKNSKLYGVELDSITGRIAKQLYQQANIAVQGFEETSLPDSFFDLAIGNVPFGSYGVADKKYDKYHFYIHDYFFGATRS